MKSFRDKRRDGRPHPAKSGAGQPRPPENRSAVKPDARPREQHN
ncbi:class I SAM-dependent rRNA methyltransferase, partial [Mesorhizobium sp. M8A.F.Ca.ET.023.02.2.1]